MAYLDGIMQCVRQIIKTLKVCYNNANIFWMSGWETKIQITILFEPVAISASSEKFTLNW